MSTSSPNAWRAPVAAIALAACATDRHAPANVAVAPPREPATTPEVASCDRALPYLHRLAMTSDSGCLIARGKVHCWTGDAAALAEPVSAQLPALTLPGEAVDVAVSNWLSCTVLSSGEVHCWGDNRQGQLGAASRLWSSESPLRVVGITHACAVAVADDHACAIEQSGAVMCWGYNGAGQCGQDREYTPGVRQLVVAERVPRISGATQIALGSYTSCAAVRGGVACWGDLLGTMPARSADAAGSDPTQPAFFGPLADTSNLAIAQGCGCAVKADRSVACFAAHTSGCPSQHPGLVLDRLNDVAGVRRLAVAPNGACAEIASGGLLCWEHPSALDAPGAFAAASYRAARMRALPAPAVDELALGSAPCVRAGNLLHCWPVHEWERGQPSEPRAIRIE